MSNDEYSSNSEPIDIKPVTPKEHLEFNPKDGQYETKPQGKRPNYVSAERDNIVFFKQQKTKIKKFETELQRDTEKFQKYFEPKYIFKLQTNPKRLIREKTFREDLKKIDIDILSSANSKNGEWVGSSPKGDFSKLVKELQKRVGEKYPTFVDTYEHISQIPVKDKIGSSLINKPFFDENVPIALDVELQPIENESVLNFHQFMNGFKQFITENGGKLTDSLINENVSVLRIQAQKKLFDQILEVERVVLVNRAPIIELEEQEKIETKELPTIIPPPDNAHGILVMDSGLTSEHPIFKDAVDDVFAISTLHRGDIQDTNPSDDSGHGTMVSSIALFGNIKSHIEKSHFQAEVRISSSKIMFSNASNEPEYDENELLEHQLQRSITRIVSTYPKCKFINLSIGNTDKTVFDTKLQFNLATMVDVLSVENKDLIFVVAAGNNESNIKESNYAGHLLKNNPDISITDPGSSVLAITVGALRNYNNETEMKNTFEYPSTYSRIGPGYNGMIKPELVEFGGDKKQKILAADFQYITHGRLFTKSVGTSLSTPIISNYLAKLYNKYPNASRNLIKALLISSAEIPEDKPTPIPQLNKKTKLPELQQVLNIYGYGKPKFFNAEFSENKRVVFKHDGKIGLNQVQFFAINLPLDFFTTKGIKEIAVTLVFDPPIKRHQTSYTGNVMNFHLFKNKELEKIESSYSVITDRDTTEVPEELENLKMDLKPGSRLRSKGVHLHGKVVFTRKNNQIQTNKPLVLAVNCQDRWMAEDTFQQSYAVVVTIKHSENEELYQQIKYLNRIQPPVRAEVFQRARVQD